MLLDEIIELLSSEGGSLTTALLKTKVLLHAIGHKELITWVNNELNGYAEDTEVPPYRVLRSRVLANLANPAFHMSEHPIPLAHLKSEQRESLEKTPLYDSLAVLEDLSAADSGHLVRPIPMELNGALSRGLGNSYRVQKAWCEISAPDIKGIFAQVRSRLLDFVLELKSSIGTTGSQSDLKSRAATLDAGNMFNNAIFGPNTTIVVGDHNVQRNIQITNAKGDFVALVATLEKAGIPADEIENLRSAVSNDEESDQPPSFETATGGWFTKLLGRAAKGSLGVGVDIVSKVGAKALAAYFGLDGP